MIKLRFHHFSAMVMHISLMLFRNIKSQLLDYFRYCQNMLMSHVQKYKSLKVIGTIVYSGSEKIPYIHSEPLYGRNSLIHYPLYISSTLFFYSHVYIIKPAFKRNTF